MIIVANSRHNKSSFILCRIGKKFKYIDRICERKKKLFKYEAHVRIPAELNSRHWDFQY